LFVCCLRVAIVRLPLSALAVVILALSPSLLTGQDEYTVTKVEFSGNREFSDGNLIDLLALSVPDWVGRSILGKDASRITQDEVDRFARILRNYYQREGYLYADVAGEVKNVDEAARTLHLRFVVREGPPIMIDSLSTSAVADSAYDTVRVAGIIDEAASLFNLKSGMRFRDESIAQDRDTLMQTFARNGYPFAAAAQKIRVHTQDSTVAVFWEVRPGPLSRFGEVTFQGNEHVSDEIVQRRLAFEVGDVFNVQKVKKSQRDLYDLGVFQIVSFKAQFDRRLEDTVPIDVTLQEAPLYSTKFGVGYGTEDKFRASVDFRVRRFLGGARTLAIRVKRSALEPYYFSFSLTQPDFIIRLTSLTVNPYALRQIEPAYSANRYGANLILSYPFALYTDASMTYNVEQVKQDSSAGSGLETSTEEPKSLYNKSSLTFLLRYDSSRPLFDPSQGIYVSPAIQFAGLFQPPSNNYMKIALDLRAYRRLSGWLVVAGRLAVGTIVAPTEDPFIPIEEKFYAGGASSIRGFERSSVGPVDADGNPLGGNSSLIGSCEFRIPIVDAFGAVVFSDFGNVWAGSLTFKPGDLRFSVGAGLRYETIIGPVRFDVAIPVPKADLPVQYYFTLGHAF
jgi:outer membrane protein insertion porin family